MNAASQPASDIPSTGVAARARRLLESGRAPWLLGLLAVVLTSTTLGTGFHLDDWVHRYLYSGKPGAKMLSHAYESPFGIANGEPEWNHWLVEKGFAPWWTWNELLISFWRPISTFTHWLEYTFWPDQAWAMHLHSMLWLGVLVATATFAYRRLMPGAAVAGLAALLYAVDHTHGFPVGWIANRNAQIATTFGLLALIHHDRWRRERKRASAFWAPGLLLAGLLSGEIALGVCAYLFAYAVCLDRGSRRARLLSLLPYGLLVVAWRLAYNLLGYGARGSGLYIDPLREPWAFLGAVIERVPLLWLGQLGMPPAEAHLFAPKPLAFALYVAGLIVLVWTARVMWPLLRRDPVARFWALGAGLALVPICTTHPNNRLLFFVGLGALGLLAQLLHGIWSRAQWLPAERGWRIPGHAFALVFGGLHLLVSPLVLPVTACGVTSTRAVEEQAVPSAMQAVRDPRDRLVIVNAPDYFFVNLIPIIRPLRDEMMPQRLRALSFGPVPLKVRRLDAHTLEVTYEGGALATPLTELYRDADRAVVKGHRVQLDGLRITVTGVTDDARPRTAEFRFEHPLDDPHMRWVKWNGQRYEPFALPQGDEARALPPAQIPLAPPALF